MQSNPRSVKNPKNSFFFNAKIWLDWNWSLCQSSMRANQTLMGQNEGRNFISTLASPSSNSVTWFCMYKRAWVKLTILRRSMLFFLRPVCQCNWCLLNVFTATFYSAGAIFIFQCFLISVPPRHGQSGTTPPLIQEWGKMGLFLQSSMTLLILSQPMHLTIHKLVFDNRYSLKTVKISRYDC